ncbi:unnamed protein product [Macrosiphum euphorbiae]|uniref:Uncharacterized protein n=1 Tax=Macrosiphum euphorbiae TaxID=13131 RepID=A0AAV0VJF9_9HEMI|nr:unnamed protein product [Macrosiphum euphorbiae]
MSAKNASKCVVNDCKSKDVICHRFPNPRTDMQRYAGSNCEEDFKEGSLSSFKIFFESAIASTSDFENQIVISADLPPTLHNLSMTTSFVRGQAQNYIAGFTEKDNETDPVQKLAYTWYLKHSKTRKTQGKFNLI